MSEETITIICDNEDCRKKCVLSMDTLRAARMVTITCKNCGEIVSVKLSGENVPGEEFFPVFG